MHVRDHVRCSEREYIERERTAEVKSEYINGYVVAMAGASIRHNLIASNVLRSFGNRLKGCLVFQSDQRVCIPREGEHFYPDISVVCGPIERHPEDRLAISNPKVIVEILSDSTEDYDRGTKFLHYRRCESLCDYVLVSQHSRCVEHYRRLENEWVLHDYRDAEVLVLASIAIHVPLDEIYANEEQIPRD